MKDEARFKEPPEEEETSGTHLSAAELVAYRSEELEPDQEQRLLGHLLECRECLDRLLLIPDPSAEPDAGASRRIADFELYAARRAIQARIRAERVERWRIPATIAASLLVAALGVSTSIAVGNGKRVAELSQPQLNVPIHELAPDGARRGPHSVAGTIEVPAHAASFTLILQTDPREAYSDYRVEILDSDEQEVWSGRGLEIERRGTGTLGLSRHFLPAGHYQVRLYGLLGEAPEEKIGEYPVEIRYLEDG